ncbi:transcription elongation factor GreA [Candidatus Uhrbacteria bacterium]|nr:transcription elongation factor GreA [Candidatus Uhrbacteria bacterium]
MPHYLTKEGLDKLKTDLHHLKTVVRKEVIERIAAAKELGDLKENAEYAEAKDEQALLESKILEYENALKEAVLINEEHGGKQTHVSVGSRVTVTLNGKEYEYLIVGSEEADPVQFRISHESPLGKAFLGKKVGDSVVVKAPKGEFTYTISSIA